jgi:hypothetical protein
MEPLFEGVANHLDADVVANSSTNVSIVPLRNDDRKS